MTPWLTDTGWAITLAAVAGLAIGSFLNVVIHRLPQMLARQWQDDAAYARGEPPAPGERYDLARPRSHCPACGRTLRLRELVPVASWIMQRGRCSACAASVSLRYPAVELATAGLFALCVVHFGTSLEAIWAMLLVALLLAAAVIDFNTRLLPDSLTLPLVWAGLLANLAGRFTSLADAVIGAAVGYLILWTVHHVFRALTGREAMGYGDFKLLAALGAWFGWQPLPAVLVIACLGGIGGAIVAALAGRRAAGQPIAFGPWLATAGLIALFAQPTLGLWVTGA